MNRRGFIFRHDSCVACGACVAACRLTNGFAYPVRNLYVSNRDAFLPAPVINLSIACNHCDKPICLEGCPADAYSRDVDTGAVLLNEDKCIGCRYCTWNCPYEAPVFDSRKKIIGKCHLCNDALSGNYNPACADGCPTGALRFGDISTTEAENIPFLPPAKLNPHLEIVSAGAVKPLIIVPEGRFKNGREPYSHKKVFDNSRWSLLVFSYLAIISVTLAGTSLIKGEPAGKLLILLAVTLTGIASLFHLGKPLRAWRAILNLRSSPLSREIVTFCLFAILSGTAAVTGWPVILLLSFIFGIVFLIAIDGVYLYSAPRDMLYHSGQTLPGSLLLISFLTGSLVPFTFMVVLKIISIFVRMIREKFNGDNYALRYFRTSVLIIIWAGMISGFAERDVLLTIIILAGEFADRYLFYNDFSTENITSLIHNVNRHKNEKERG